MGMKMIQPGMYEPDPMSGQDDFGRYQMLMGLSRMPAGSKQTKRLHNFEEVRGREEGLKSAIDFINGKIDPPIMLLYGAPGRSKTHLALAIGWACLAQLKSVLYYEVVELLDELRSGYRIQLPAGEHDLGSHEAIMERLKNYAVLILDDLGVEKSTDWAAERLDHIVNYRYLNCKPTVITTNILDISDRILDRCKEGRVVLLKGESYRDIISRRRGKEYREPTSS